MVCILACVIPSYAEEESEDAKFIYEYPVYDNVVYEDVRSHVTNEFLVDLGDGDPVPLPTYANAVALLEHLIELQKTEIDGEDDDWLQKSRRHENRFYMTQREAFRIMENLSGEPVSDSVNYTRSKELIVHILTNRSMAIDTSFFLYKLPSDYLDEYHKALHESLKDVAFDYENASMEYVLGVYARLPSCDVTFVTNKAYEVQDSPLIGDAILARHGDEEALKRLQELTENYTMGLGFSYSYLSTMLSLVRTRPMVEILVIGLRSNDIIELPGGMQYPRYAIYRNALWRMLRHDADFPAWGTCQEYEEWCVRKFGLTLPPNLPERTVPSVYSKLLFIINTNTVDRTQ